MPLAGMGNHKAALWQCHPVHSLQHSFRLLRPLGAELD